ncbi:Hsp20/alpha crystallin family protein [Aureisphaera galaxeae]|uniref:Hsp20/alpha crystallin family protein n=1 Tax=Aureisphaera galaxeae TaxID=1538023 RepID=UPI002350F5D6|nr:Hsp20/alpha crystallin family protein [Aureisphaera galaxeae]MDC8003782.1 Hsp20/alpha crystallin family protein [Aureisphaera galaxeae]
MSLIKFNKRRFPWLSEGLSPWFDTDDFFADDFFIRDRNVPAMNVKENSDSFEIELAVPGFSKEDIEVTMENEFLHVCAKKKSEETEEGDEGYTRKEFSYQEFDRRMRLPSSVNRDKEVQATYKDGILKLHLLKNEELQSPSKKVIEIV